MMFLRLVSVCILPAMSLWERRRQGFVADDLIAERDSRKDEAVVFIFIVATVGLLGWAAIRPWVAKWYQVRLQKSANSHRLCTDIWQSVESKRTEKLYSSVDWRPLKRD